MAHPSWHAQQSKGMDTENLYINHAQTNRAPKQRRRTYRAHGRINRESGLYTGLSLELIGCLAQVHVSRDHASTHYVAYFPVSITPSNTAYMSSPAHLEIILGEKPVGVKKEEAPLKLSRKRQAQRRVRIGGGN